MWRAGATAYRYRCLVPATRFLGTSVVAGETMKRLALACFLPASAAVAATATLLQRQGHLVRGVGQGGRVHRQQLRARQGLKGKCPDTCAAAVLLPHTHSLLSLISCFILICSL